MIVLRDYQERAFTAIRERFAAKLKKVVVVSPTGSGKGTLAAKLLVECYQHGRPALFVVHRKEIVEDIYKRVLDGGVPQTGVGMIRAQDKRRNAGALIQIASIDSLKGRALPPASLLVMDECHRTHSASQRTLLEQYPSAYLVGLTATPQRLDGKGLNDIFQDIYVVAQPVELIRAGWIVRPSLFTAPPDHEPDVSGVATTAGDYNQKQLGAVVKKKHLVGSIVDHWQQRAEGRQTVVFAVDVEHSRMLVGAFLAAGIHAEHVDGSMSEGERDDILGRFRAELFPVLSQCQLLVEGVDIPAIKCVVQARPTQSLTFYLQSLGRAGRPYKDLKMLTLDHAGNARVHGRPDQYRDWEEIFYRKKKRRVACEAPIKRCPECFNMEFAGARVCGTCGYVFVSDGQIKTVDGELVEVAPPTPEEEKRDYWNHQSYTASDQHLDLAWVRARFRACFQEEAPADWVLVPRPPRKFTEDEKATEWRKCRALAMRQHKDFGWAAFIYRKIVGEDPPKPHPAPPPETPAAPTPKPSAPLFLDVKRRASGEREPAEEPHDGTEIVADL